MGMWRDSEDKKSNIVKWWRLAPMPAIRVNNNDPSSDDVESREEQDTADEKTGKKRTSMEAAAERMHLKESEMDILSRFEKERQAEEERRKKEIEDVRKQAAEQEKVAAIMKASKVDVNTFIEEGRQGQKH